MLNNKYISLLLLLTFSISFLYCNEQRDNGSSNDSKDSSKLGGERILSELGIRFNPPKDWEPAPSEVSGRVIARITRQKRADDKFVFVPRKIYYSKSSFGLLSAGIIRVNGVDSLSGDEMNVYGPLLKKRYSRNEISENYISQNGFEITRFVIKKDNLISFRLVFPNLKNNLIQLEYSIQKEFYKKEIEKIEASISSIEPVK